MEDFGDFAFDGATIVGAMGWIVNPKESFITLMAFILMAAFGATLFYFGYTEPECASVFGIMVCEGAEITFVGWVGIIFLLLGGLGTFFQLVSGLKALFYVGLAVFFGGLWFGIKALFGWRPVADDTPEEISKKAAEAWKKSWEEKMNQEPISEVDSKPEEVSNLKVERPSFWESAFTIVSALALFWAIAVFCYFLIDILNLESWDSSQVQPLGWVVILAIVSLIGYATYSVVSNKNRF